MNARLHAVIALLLPLMLLRGLLPEGYMASTTDGALRIVLCSEGLFPADSGRPAPASHSDDCVFAHATFAAPLPAAAGLKSPPALRDLPVAVRPVARHTSHNGPRRAESARAPPALSA